MRKSPGRMIEGQILLAFLMMSLAIGIPHAHGSFLRGLGWTLAAFAGFIGVLAALILSVWAIGNAVQFVAESSLFKRTSENVWAQRLYSGFKWLLCLAALVITGVGFTAITADAFFGGNLASQGRFMAAGAASGVLATIVLFIWKWKKGLAGGSPKV